MPSLQLEPMVPGIAIIIVNYRTPHLVADCLCSLARDRSRSIPFSVIVVDNYSRDNSLNFLQEKILVEKWSDWVTLLALPRNGGFAYGNNRAITMLLEKEKAPHYIWLLNPDTVVHKNACSSLLNFLEGTPGAGIAGSRLEGLDGNPQVSAFRDHSIASELLSGLRLGILDSLFKKWRVAKSLDTAQPIQVDWVSGASMIIRREVFDEIGLLDENFFMYFEEVDFCIRARAAGWSCWHVPASRVVHMEGAASGITGLHRKQGRRPAYWFESRHRFFLKHHGKAGVVVADLAWMTGYSLWCLRRFLQGKDRSDPPYFFWDFFRHCSLIRGFRL